MYSSILQYCEALTYLVYAYETNTVLQAKGASRGADSSLIALYRRKCLLPRREGSGRRGERLERADHPLHAPDDEQPRLQGRPGRH
ncbi:Ubiquitin carboxyl-terminal hydrolase 28, partial [Ophiophagus hannah]